MTSETMTQTMRAAVYSKSGGPEVVHIAQVPRPEPKPNEVLIRVHASTVSIADYRTRSHDLPKGMAAAAPFVFGIRKPRQPILGTDVAGVIEHVGSAVTRFAVGDKVLAYPGFRMGGHAEYVVMPEDGLVALAPKNLPLEDAVSLLFGGLTAHLFLNLVTIEPGDEVLVNGASGSTGSATVQLAKAWGARVTAVSSKGNHDLVRSLGADEVIDYAVTDFAANGKVYDIIVDCVGNAPFSRVGSSVKPGGALLLVIVQLRGMLTARRDSKRSGKLVTFRTPPATASDLQYLVTLAEAGKFVPVIDRRYTLDDIVEAHRYVGTWRKRGNLVVTIG